MGWWTLSFHFLATVSRVAKNTAAQMSIKHVDFISWVHIFNSPRFRLLDFKPPQDPDWLS